MFLRYIFSRAFFSNKKTLACSVLVYLDRLLNSMINCKKARCFFNSILYKTFRFLTFQTKFILHLKKWRPLMRDRPMNQRRREIGCRLLSKFFNRLEKLVTYKNKPFFAVSVLLKSLCWNWLWLQAWYDKQLFFSMRNFRTKFTVLKDVDQSGKRIFSIFSNNRTK